MKAYAVQYRDTVGNFDGDVCIWFSCKAKAIAKAKELRDEVSTLTEEWEELQSNTATYQVFGVSKVAIPTGKKELIEWLNKAECEDSGGRRIWSPDGGE